MRTTTVQQVPQQWAEILGWIAAGEEVQVTEQDAIVAKFVPAVPGSVVHPDFVGRAKAIWGERPPGKLLSELVSEGRGALP
jgi:antitoxin (DNA-binding transcriptional repressor) of toxin-antitoxin stability system